MSRFLDYCAARSLLGRDLADEMFGRNLPPGFDLDQPGDETMAARIVEEQPRCDACPSRQWCED